MASGMWTASSPLSQRCLWNLISPLRPQTIKFHPTCHYLHHIIRLFHKKYLKQLNIFRYCLYHSNITNLFIFKVSINQVTRNSFRSVMPLLDYRCRIDTFICELCNTFCNKKYTVQYNSLTWSKDMYAHN